MSSQESLKAAMRESLETNGTISHIKAELRAAVVERLTDVTNSGDSRAVANPPVPPENLIINELIKEYLTFNGLEHTLAVFQLEGRTPDSQVPRRVLASELNMAAAPSSVPLLYAILHEARLSKEMGQ
jgi:lisH domain-containing protein FOPNL